MKGYYYQTFRQILDDLNNRKREMMLSRTQKPGILIIGHGRHGKDELAETWAKYFDFTFSSSSRAAAELFLFDKLKSEYGYTTFEECYADRRNRRVEWADAITEFNTPDRTRLARHILTSNDAYVGMRKREELLACKESGLFDLIIWVDASERVPPESSGSMDVSQHDADIIIDNNGSLADFRKRAMRLGRYLFSPKTSLHERPI